MPTWAPNQPFWAAASLLVRSLVCACTLAKARPQAEALTHSRSLPVQPCAQPEAEALETVATPHYVLFEDAENEKALQQNSRVDTKHTDHKHDGSAFQTVYTDGDASAHAGNSSEVPAGH
jgi:hypothetical protein